MNNSAQNQQGTEIDLLALLGALWSHAVVIISATLIAGVVALAYTLFFVTPLYQSSAMLYVNNNSLSVGTTKIDMGDLTASKSLAATYTVILKSRTTLEQVIARADLDYRYDTLDRMITADTVNDTEVFRVTVTSSDPVEAEKIANTIIEVLPDRINTIMEGSAVKIVDTAIVPDRYVSPSFRKNTVIGMMLGFVLSCGFYVIVFMLDTLIHSENTLLEEYPEIPLLAVVPRVGEGSGSYYSYGYGQKPDNSGNES